MSIVAVESSAEAACWARRRQQQRRAADGRRQAGYGRLLACSTPSRATDSDWDSQATVLDEEPEEGDTDDKLTQKIMSFHEFIHES